MKILVTNNRAGAIQLKHTKNETALMLSPGVNEVDVETWDRCKALPLVETLKRTKVESVKGRVIEATAGKMQLVEGKVIGGEGLKGLPPRVAQTVLEDVLDPRLLSKWLGEEKRAEVRTLIEARIAALTPKDEKKAS